MYIGCVREKLYLGIECMAVCRSLARTNASDRVGLYGMCIEVDYHLKIEHSGMLKCEVIVFSQWLVGFVPILKLAPHSFIASILLSVLIG